MMDAVFKSDFRSFVDAIDKAELRLRTFDDNAHKAGDTLDKFGNRFSGTKVIQDAIAMDKAIRDLGGSAVLTEKELQQAAAGMAEAIEKAEKTGRGGAITQSMRDLAAQAKTTEQGVVSLSGTVASFAKMAAGAFAADKIVSFGKEVLDFAGHMQDLHDETGVATDDLQALNLVAAGAGLTLDDVTKSAEQLGKRLTSGDESAVKAVEKLGLSVEQLQGLDPVSQLKAIGTAASGIADPMERNVAMMELFGKTGARMARIVTDDLGNLMDQAKASGGIIDADLIAKADQFGDAIGAAMIRGKAALVTFVGEAIDLWNTLPWNREKDPWNIDPRKWGAALDDALGTGRSISDRLQVPGELPKGMLGPATPKEFFSGPLGAKKKTDTGPGSAKWLADQAKLLAASEKKTLADRTAAQKQAEKDAEQLEAARQKRIKDQFGAKPPSDEDLERMIFGVTSKEAEKVASDWQSLLTQQTRDLARMQASGPYVPGMKETKPTADDFPLPTFMNSAKVADWIRQGKFQDALKDAGADGAKTFATSFEDYTRAHFGTNVIAAITGGGDIGKAIGATLGEGITQSIFSKDSGLMKALTGKGGIMGSILGSFASFLPGIGSLLGPAVSGIAKLFGGLFGGGEGKKTNDARDSWIAANFGTSDNLRQLAVQAGVTDEALRRLFSVSKVKDFEAASKAVADQIGAFNDEQAADLERLNAAITKYGFSFEELGSKTQLDQINAQAKELIEDWRVLVGSGIDVAAVNTHMADSINDFLQTALKVGAEIPAAMEPILQQMAEQGTLTDAAGNKITDLKAAGITFSETMTQGFDRVVKKLEELIKKIGGVGSAIDAIPSEKDIALNYSYNMPDAPTVPTPELNGYYAQMPGFKDGTEGKFLNFGAGTPVVLHGSERVVTAGEVTESSASMVSMVGAMTSMQTSIIRAIRENALQVRDQSMIMLGARN